MAVGGGGAKGSAVGDALNVFESGGDDVVGSVLDPPGGGGVGGAAVGWVVFEAAVFGWVVGWRDDDAVCESVFSLRVVGEDGVGECGGRGVGEIVVDHDFDVVGGEDFEGGGEGGLGEGVGILGEEEGASGFLCGAVFDDGLGDGGDVVVVECGVEGAATMTRGSERYALGGDIHVGVEGVEGGDEAGDVNEGVRVGKVAGLIGGWN